MSTPKDHLTSKETPMSKPTVGRIVHYTLESGHVRPAIVVGTWPDNDLLQLQVLVDGSNDGESRYGKDSGITPEEGKAGLAWRTSVHQGKEDQPEPGCWHWPPRS
jgi:hypothetical protein